MFEGRVRRSGRGVRGYGKGAPSGMCPAVVGGRRNRLQAGQRRAVQFHDMQVGLCGQGGNEGRRGGLFVVGQRRGAEEQRLWREGFRSGGTGGGHREGDRILVKGTHGLAP